MNILLMSGGWLLLGFISGSVFSFWIYPKLMRLWVQRGGGKVVLKSAMPCVGCGCTLSDWDFEEDYGELPICEECGDVSGAALIAFYKKAINARQKVVDRLSGELDKLKQGLKEVEDESSGIRHGTDSHP